MKNIIKSSSENNDSDDEFKLTKSYKFNVSDFKNQN